MCARVCCRVRAPCAEDLTLSSPSQFYERARDAYALQIDAVSRWYGWCVGLGLLPALVVVLYLELFLIRWWQRTKPTTRNEAHLQAITRLALRRRMLQSGLSLAIGGVLFGCSLPWLHTWPSGLWPMYGYGTSPLGSPFLWAVLGPVGITVAFLCILSSDTIAVRLKQDFEASHDDGAEPNCWLDKGASRDARRTRTHGSRCTAHPPGGGRCIFPASSLHRPLLTRTRVLRITVALSACIDQAGDINASLKALPLFLLLSRRFVVFAGESYTKRLWCVLELFTFLRSGGTLERIVVKPLDLDLAKVVTLFDIRKADCFLRGDMLRLLGIVEASYGSFGQFNAAVRKILLAKLGSEDKKRADQTDESASTDVSVFGMMVSVTPKVAPKRGRVRVSSRRKRLPKTRWIRA